MRNRWYLFFWTELGRRTVGDPGALPAHLPEAMATVLSSPAPVPPAGRTVLGEPLQPRQGRFIYGHVWEELRGMGFSRPLRLEPWPGISLLIPFYRDRVAVMPQSFSHRVPPGKRALSLVGRSVAAERAGITLWVSAARWNDDLLAVLRRGGVRVCSPDMLKEVFRGDHG